MALTKPTDQFEWASTDVNGVQFGQPNKVEPTVEKIAAGWDELEIPSRNHLNYIVNNLTQWVAFVDSFVKLGSGSPEGVVTADPGVLYLDTTGGAGTTLYVKETGTSNVGWGAK